MEKFNQFNQKIPFDEIVQRGSIAKMEGCEKTISRSTVRKSWPHAHNGLKD